MRRVTFAWKVSVGAVAAACGVSGVRDASACGGCFHPPTQTVTDITDERMLLSVSPTQSTLYDQIQYSGLADVVRLGAADPRDGRRGPERRRSLRLDRRADRDADQSAAAELSRPANCVGSQLATPASGAAAGSASAEVPAVHGARRPRTSVRTRRCSSTSTDSSALDNWLAQNGYNIPTGVTPVIAAYVTEGFDFLAMKLLPEPGRPGDASGARHDARARRSRCRFAWRRSARAPPSGITIWVVSRRALRAAELPVLSHRRQPARVGLRARARATTRRSARAERSEPRTARAGRSRARSTSTSRPSPTSS